MDTKLIRPRPSNAKLLLIKVTNFLIQSGKLRLGTFNLDIDDLLSFTTANVTFSLQWMQDGVLFPAVAK